MATAGGISGEAVDSDSIAQKSRVRQIILPSLSLFFFLSVQFTTLPGAEPITANASKFLGNILQYGGIPSDFDEYWNQVTPENAGKWGVVERTRDRMSWRSLDEAYEYAKERGFPFKQHAFVWGNQTPSWVEDLIPEEQLEEVEEWIREYAERYPETDFIDVVNEPLNAPAGYREALGGSGETGWDWVVTSFELARQYCPNAKLLINDFYIISHATNVAAYMEIAKILQERGLIDGIGIQSHYFSLQWVDTIAPPPPEVLRRNLDSLATAGLPIYISELDIYGNDTSQVTFYKDLFPLLWEHPAVAGITLWGWIEGRTWAPNTFLMSDGVERPALIWLREYIKDHPMSVNRPYNTVSPAYPSPSPKPASNGLFIYTGHPQRMLLRFVDLHGRSVAGVAAMVPGRGMQRIPFSAKMLAPGIYPGSVKGNDCRQTYFNYRVVK
jgi:GH35 family endo-1,4-beta-xylanase